MGKKIFVTGASGAFGSVICKQLKEAGHTVVGAIGGFDDSQYSEAISELRALDIPLVKMDVRNDISVTEAVEAAITQLDGLDIVINNAGVGSYGIQESFSADDMQKVFDVNVFGVQRVNQAVLPYLRKQGSGTIMYTSSIIGRLAFPFYATYCSSKFALEALASSYQAELAGFGIHSCIIEPGAMPTQFFDHMIRPQNSDVSYDELNKASEEALAGLLGAIEHVPDQRPERVAEAYVALIDMPTDTRPYRTIVDTLGLAEIVDEYNKCHDEVMNRVMTHLGS